MRIFESIRKEVEGTVGRDWSIRGLWFIEYRNQVDTSERCFSGHLLVAQTLGQGCCHSDHKPGLSLDTVGGNNQSLLEFPTPEAVAILDSLHDGIVRKQASYTVEIHGDPRDKAGARADLIASEAKRLVARGSKVLLIGFVRNVARALSEAGFSIVASDQDIEVAGSSIDGVRVHAAIDNVRLSSEAELIVATGMTIATDTIDEIVQCAHSGNAKLMFFAQSGASLARDYLKFGAHAVISEPFPKYDFHGKSLLNVYRA